MAGDIDVERVHKVLNGELRGRGCGKMTAIIYEAIEAIEAAAMNGCKTAIMVESRRESYHVAGVIQDIASPRSRG